MTHVVEVPRRSCRELFITAVPEGDAPAATLVADTARVLQETGIRIISQNVFGFWNRQPDVERAISDVFGTLAWPITWHAQRGSSVPGRGGIQTWAVADVPTTTLCLDGRVVGTIFEDNWARYCHLAGLAPPDPFRPRAAQAREVLELMERALRVAGMDFRHVRRTWFHNADIVSWYKEFNQARTSFFAQRQVFGSLVPASTAVGRQHADNVGQPALLAEAFAVQAKTDDLRMFDVASPLQHAALEYGSSFSRAVELVAPDHRRLLVSGTASIDRDGRTVHSGDLGAQIAHTFDVVHAILEARGLDWPDVTRAIAYFKRSEDIAAYHASDAGESRPNLPMICVESDICRGDLLFELELDAVRSTQVT